MANEAKVGLRIGHKIQPRKFESLEVALYVEETVDTSTNRNDNVDAFVARVTDDFKRSFDSVLESLGVQDKPVSVTLVEEDGTVKTAAQPVAPTAAKREVTVKVEGAKKSLAPKKDELDDFFDGV